MLLRQQLQDDDSLALALDAEQNKHITDQDEGEEEEEEDRPRLKWVFARHVNAATVVLFIYLFICHFNHIALL